MSDDRPVTSSDQAAPGASSATPQKQAAKKGPFFVIGGLGCVLLFWVGLLIIGSGLFFLWGRLTGPSGEAIAREAGISIEGAAGTGQTGPVSAGLPEDEAAPNGLGPAAEADKAAISGRSAPEIGPITFALTTTAGSEPIEPDFSFEAGVSQLHAVFEYSRLTPGQLWTQVWYHNGNEVLSTSQPWPEDESGVFDYLIEAWGEPIPAGQWAL